MAMMIPQIHERDADFVFLQGVRSEDVLAFAEGLGMQQWFHPRLYQALGTKPRGPVGCLVLSKHALYDAAPLRASSGGACVGVQATAVVEGVRFLVATGRAGGEWEESVEAAFRGRGSPPMITASESVKTRGGASHRWNVVRGGRVEVRGVARGLWADVAPGKDPEDQR